jgi:hypothetical protein
MLRQVAAPQGRATYLIILENCEISRNATLAVTGVPSLEGKPAQTDRAKA